MLRANLQDVYLLRANLNEANLRGADLRRADLSGAYLSDATLSESDLSDAYLLESHLIRTNLDGSQMTGCCIYNWHIENLDLSKVNCRYVFTQFNYATKSPTERYPVGRELEPGELGHQYQQDGSAIEVYFTEPPNWEALVFTLAQVELESHELDLTVRSYEVLEDNYLVRIATNRLVNAKILNRRIFQLYPDILQRMLSRRTDILNLLDIKANASDLELALDPPNRLNQRPVPYLRPIAESAFTRKWSDKFNTLCCRKRQSSLCKVFSNCWIFSVVRAFPPKIFRRRLLVR